MNNDGKLKQSDSLLQPPLGRHRMALEDPIDAEMRIDGALQMFQQAQGRCDMEMQRLHLAHPEGMEITGDNKETWALRTNHLRIPRRGLWLEKSGPQMAKAQKLRSLE